VIVELRSGEGAGPVFGKVGKVLGLRGKDLARKDIIGARGK